MIKKIVTILLCLSVTQAAFTEQIMFLDGINSSMEFLYSLDETPNYTDQNTTNTDTEVIIKDMVKGYEDLDDDGMPDTDQILIGHSQGGLRALAYAEELHKQGKDNRVKAIVTIGSPVQGEHALLYGGAHLQKRVKKRIDATLQTGRYIIYPIFPVAIMATLLIDVFTGASSTDYITHMSSADAFMDSVFGSLENDSSGAVGFIRKALNDPNIGFAPGALDALTPGSSFQKKYILPETKFIPKPLQIVKKLVGYKTVYKIVGWNWIFPIIKADQVPVYKTFIVIPTPTIEVTKRLTENQYVGHVTGGGANAFGSDILQMIEDVAGDTLGAQSKEDIQFWLNTVSISSGIAGALYAGEAVACTVAGFFTFGLGFILAIPYTVASANCFDTASFFGDFNTNFSKEIYLTTAHDGFVNTSGMVYPSGNANLWIVNNNRNDSIKYFPELNHMTERTSSKVWGEGSFDSRSFDAGSEDEEAAIYKLVNGITTLRTGRGGY